MAARAKAPGLAGMAQQNLVPAAVAANPGKAAVQVAAGDKALQHLLFDATLKGVGLFQLR